MLEDIECLDVDAYLRHMAAGVEVRLPDSSVLRGKNEVRAALGPAWRALRSLVHHEVNVQGTASTVVHEAVADSVTRTGKPPQRPSRRDWTATRPA